MNVVVDRSSLGWSVGTLTPPPEVADHPLTSIEGDLSQAVSVISLIEVVCPALQMTIEIRNEFRDGNHTQFMVGHLPDNIALFSHRLQTVIHHREAVRVVFTRNTLERVPKKVKALVVLIEDNYLCFLTIDCEAQPSFDRCFDPRLNLGTNRFGLNHKVVCIAYDLCSSPNPGTTGPVELLLKPVEVEIGQERGDHSPLGGTFPVRLASVNSIITPLNDWRFEPTPNQLEDFGVTDAHL